MGWCQQAKYSGVLMGDLCAAQSIALQIAINEDGRRSWEKVNAIQKDLNGMMDVWLFLEHKKMWNKKHEKDEAERSDATEIDASTMGELRQKLMMMH